MKLHTSEFVFEERTDWGGCSRCLWLVWGWGLLRCEGKCCGIGCKELFFYFESSIIKPTTLNTNEQEATGGAVADPVACVVSMPPKYQLCSSKELNEVAQARQKMAWTRPLPITDPAVLELSEVEVE